MSSEYLLAQMGYRPKGSGGNGIGELISGLAEVSKMMQDEQTKEAERKQKKFDQFKTLRDAGYSSAQAYDLILKGEGLPMPEGDGTTSVDKQQKTFGINKNVEVPEGMKVAGYDQKGNPMIREDKPNIPQQKFEVEQKEKEEQQKIKSQIVKDSALDVLDSIAAVKKGVENFGLTGQLPSFPGTARVDWEANIDKLLSGKIIDVMTKMKEASKTGATGFGQLSNRELGVLQNASTALKRSLRPEDAIKYLDAMEAALKKVAQGEGGDVVQPIKSGKTSKGISWSVEE